MTQIIYSVATEDLDLDTFDVDSQFEMTSPDMPPQIPDYLSESDERPKMKPLAKVEGNILQFIASINPDF